jgi:acetolactate synthase I/II/III large subunit
MESTAIKQQNAHKQQIMKKVTGSEAVLLSLIEEGVEVMFGYPGGNIMPIYDALYDYQQKIRHILTRHEQGAAHAAQGYARTTGKVGVCMATSGPGATNLITGIADAMLDSTPMVCITGQVGSLLLGTDAFQETDVIGITMPVTKWNYQVTKAADIADAIAKAFYIARTGRPGPVLIDITKDAQFAEVDFKYKKCEGIRSYVPVPKFNPEKIEEAANLINKAERPMALIGQGVILGGAEKEVTTFLEKAGIPFAWTLLGLSAIPTEHPLNIGMLGMHGNYGPNRLTNECDVLIAIGMRFDDRVTGDVKRYAKQAKVIHMEIDPAEVDKNVKSAVAILGDVKETLPLLTGKIKTNLHHEWIQKFKNHSEIEHEKVIQKDMYPEKPGLSMGEVIRRINENANGEAILVTDVGQHQMVAARYTKFKHTRSIVTSGGLGTMGFGLPAAIGAKLGCPDKQVIAIIGDGGFQMTIQELGTIFQTGVAVKIVILNNDFLGMVRQWQQLFFDKRYSSTEMINPDFLTIAKGYCIDGQRVSDRAELDDAVKKMLDHNGPYLLEVKVEKEGNVFPMVPAGCSVSEIRLE